MADVATIQASLTGLSANVDSLIALVVSLKADIETLKNAGGATPDQLAALQTQVDGIAGKAQAALA